jgi:hypothetical protein
MPEVGFEPTITASERTMAVHALERYRDRPPLIEHFKIKFCVWKVVNLMLIRPGSLILQIIYILVVGVHEKIKSRIQFLKFFKKIFGGCYKLNEFLKFKLRNSSCRKTCKLILCKIWLCVSE